MIWELNSDRLNLWKSHSLRTAFSRSRVKKNLETFWFRNNADQSEVLRSILGKITDGFFVVDKEWNILIANEPAAQIAASSVEDVIGRNLWDVVPQYRDTIIYEHYLKAMESGEPEEFVTYLDAVQAWIETRLYPSESGLTSYFRQLSEKEVKALEAKQREENVNGLESSPLHSETQAASPSSSSRSDEEEDLRRESTAIASHDLKEPLKSVALWLDMAEQNRTEEVQRDYIHRASSNVKKCLDLIESLLDNSRLQAGDLATEEVSVQEVVEGVKENLNSLIGQYKAVLKVEALPKIEANKTYLMRIFQNLISNSIKYSHPNRRPLILVKYQRRNEYHEFRVEDNGLGLELENPNQAFDLYERAHRNSEIAGNGFGLAIVKKLVELHGGQVELRSVSGEMTEVTFLIPEHIPTPKSKS